MLDELIRSNAVDKRWAEELIAGAATLEDLERAAIGTAESCSSSNPTSSIVRPCPLP